MGFLAPAAFALAALIPIVIAMYLLKLRRTEQVVSSVYLWRRMVRDVEANAPWQRLRRNLLLLLQLLFLSALILALARPFTRMEGTVGEALILILDTSASMAATDVPPSRLASAQAQARQLIDNLPDNARVTVITAGQGAQVLVSSSQDRREAHLAIDRAQAGAGGSDLTAALELASAIAARQPDTEIAVFSDGRVTLPERLTIKGRVRYIPVGQGDNNQAIGTLSLQPAPARGDLEAFAQVVNYGSQHAQRRLSLYADGQLVNAYDLEIPPGEQRAVVAPDLPMGVAVIEAQLDGQDVLPLDDRAWAVYQPTDPVGVTLVSSGNLFLETALALLPGLELTVARPEDWEAARLEAPGPIEPSGSQTVTFSITRPADLTVFDAFVPITNPLPAGNLLFIAPPRSTEFFSVTGTAEQPVPRPAQALGADKTDPLLSNVTIADVSVLDAVRLPLPDWARPVIVGDTPSGSVPLLFVGEVEERRIAVLAFDLHRSDLPLQVAFPLLLANLTGWLAPAGGSEVPAQVAPGAAVGLALPPDVNSLTVTRPDGSMARVGAEGGRAVFGDTDQLGVYQLEWGDRFGRFAVNLFSPEESRVSPLDRLSLSGSAEAEEAGMAQQARREWWRSLAFLALAVLMGEWLVYHRATIARLWATLRP